MPYMECKICDKEFTGPEPYAQHLTSKAHILKMNETGTNKSQLYEGASNAVASTEQYRCDICEVDLSGPVPFEQHLNGGKHKAMLNKKRIVEEQGSKTTNEETALSLKCEVCDKCFTGPESYEDHVKSKKHQRKVEMSEVKERLTNQEPASCPPLVDDSEQPENDQKLIYPPLPKKEMAVIPTRAEAQKKKDGKTKKPTGCFSVFRSSLKKKKNMKKN